MILIHRVAVIAVFLCACALRATEYDIQKDITYCTVENKDGKKFELKFNAFLPKGIDKPAPVMVDIHGGWWEGGKKSDSIIGMWGGPVLSKIATDRGIAFFSIDYRLGKDGGFPEEIRDCRNAIRFIRKNAAKFNIDPERIGCFGGSAGSHLSAMCAVVPEDFDDGGPTEDLKGVSAKVCNAFSFVGPWDFVEQWNEAPDDVNPDGTFRPANPKIRNDARPRHRRNFKGIIPDTEEHKALYRKMSPIGHVRKDVAPLLICDGEIDDVVPGHPGQSITEKFKAVGADATYWMSPKIGHAFPGGEGFEKVLADFLDRTLKIK
ncbi:MAG TPA: alpha/beta hydrolase [Planctomycetota bacterium]|nr:alpha/beta hydrolase [Planctomycetota bacterium]